jgi:hypothetical protein
MPGRFVDQWGDREGSCAEWHNGFKIRMALSNETGHGPCSVTCTHDMG